jgi:hypothetical protein
MESYTLQLVDNTAELKLAVDNMRRVNVQFSAKMIGNHQLRPGIYDLLQKVRGGKGRGPLSSNLPSENILLGIGSKRIAGTGRTAGIKAKKLAQQGVVESTDSAQSYLVGAREGSDLTFLKNAIGQEIAFTVVKGGGARANLLATNRQRRQKLMDAAASRVGADLPISALMQKRKRESEELEKAKKRNKTTNNAPTSLDFLKNNIGRTEREAKMEEERQREIVLDDDDDDYDDQADGKDGIILTDGLRELQALTDEERHAKFQALYKLEMERQRKVLNLEAEKGTDGLSLPHLTSEDATDVEDNGVIWEDG